MCESLIPRRRGNHSFRVEHEGYVQSRREEPGSPLRLYSKLTTWTPRASSASERRARSAATRPTIACHVRPLVRRMQSITAPTACCHAEPIFALWHAPHNCAAGRAAAGSGVLEVWGCKYISELVYFATARAMARKFAQSQPTLAAAAPAAAAAGEQQRGKGDRMASSGGRAMAREGLPGSRQGTRAPPNSAS